jgi:hypothetical protein
MLYSDPGTPLILKLLLGAIHADESAWRRRSNRLSDYHIYLFSAVVCRQQPYGRLIPDGSARMRATMAPVRGSDSKFSHLGSVRIESKKVDRSSAAFDSH